MLKSEEEVSLSSKHRIKGLVDKVWTTVHKGGEKANKQICKNMKKNHNVTETD